MFHLKIKDIIYKDIRCANAIVGISCEWPQKYKCGEWLFTNEQWYESVASLIGPIPRIVLRVFAGRCK